MSSVNTRDAVALIAGAVGEPGGTWADLGAGTGTFTRALAELLGATSRIYAVDRDPADIDALKRWSVREAPNVIPVEADFTRALNFPQLHESLLNSPW